MKLAKFFSLVLGVIVLFASCEKKSLSLRDGTFIGKGRGRNGPVEVSITVKNGKIVRTVIYYPFKTTDGGVCLINKLKICTQIQILKITVTV